MRLTTKGRELGLVDDVRWRAFEEKRDAIAAETTRLNSTWVRPETLPEADAQRVLGTGITHEYCLMDLLRRPDVTYASLMTLPNADTGVADSKVSEQVEIQAKYSGYIDRQHDEIERSRRNEETHLPVDLDYDRVSGLSSEVRQKFNTQRPDTLGQAARIPGVTPAAISLLLVHLKKRSGQRRLG